MLAALAADPSHMRGVIEQRVVDAIANRIRPTGSRSRGLGDPVNAANTPRRKLGACEFQDIASSHVVAYEAHAGVLTETYVGAHLAGLDRGIRPDRRAASHRRRAATRCGCKRGIVDVVPCAPPSRGTRWRSSIGPTVVADPQREAKVAT